MSSPSPSRSSTPSDNTNAIPDAPPQEPDLPLTMKSSMILTALPPDAATALSSASEFPNSKVIVHFKAVGSAPTLPRSICRISSTQRFEAVVAYLRRVLKVGPMDSVFLYVNSSFAPALDEVVGNLHQVSGILVLFPSHSYVSLLIKIEIVLQRLKGPSRSHVFDDARVWMKTVLRYTLMLHQNAISDENASHSPNMSTSQRQIVMHKQDRKTG